MEQIGRFIVMLCTALVVVGLAVWGLGKLGYRGMPGGIVYKSDRVSVVFPLATCLLLSLLLTAAAWLWRWFYRG